LQFCFSFSVVLEENHSLGAASFVLDLIHVLRSLSLSPEICMFCEVDGEEFYSQTLKCKGFSCRVETVEQLGFSV
jgi:hypothetical protein